MACEVVNLRKSEYDVYIGRGDNGDAHIQNTEIGERGWLGNPFPVENIGRETSIELFEWVFTDMVEHDEEFRKAVRDLEDKTLGCFCKPKDCHGDVIAREVRRLTDPADARDSGGESGDE